MEEEIKKVLDEIERKYSTTEGNLVDENNNIKIKALRLCREEFENVINNLENEIKEVELMWLPKPQSEEYVNLNSLEESIIKYKVVEKIALRVYNIKTPKIYRKIINKKLEEKGIPYRMFL